jgi:hypothetical protein
MTQDNNTMKGGVRAVMARATYLTFCPEVNALFELLC